MLIVVFVEEIDDLLGVTLGALNECNFETRVIQESHFRILSQNSNKLIVLGKHPTKRHNGGSDHRRRFAYYEYCGVQAIGYAEGAKQDNLWWRDLHYKLRDLIRKNCSGKEQYDLLFDLSRLSKLKIE